MAATSHSNRPEIIECTPEMLCGHMCEDRPLKPTRIRWFVIGFGSALLAGAIIITII